MAQLAATRSVPTMLTCLVGLAMIVGGCSPSQPDPAITPTPATAAPATPAPAPTTTEPEPEPTSTLPTSRAESSWEVVEQFFDAYTYGLQTGDSTRLKTLSTDDCATCANFIASIDELRARKVVGSGGELMFPYSEGMRTPHSERDVWYVRYQQGEIDRTLGNPADTFRQDETSGEMYVELTEVVDGWLVSKISAEAQKDDE